MGVKGKLKKDHIPVNKFTLIVVGIDVPITFTTISGIEEELDVADLPDRTKASGGNTKAFEFTGKVPMHHLAEQAALEKWLIEGQDPVSPLYQKTGTLIHESITGLTVQSYTLDDVFTFKRTLPELDINNEGDLAEVEWSFAGNDIYPT